MVVWLAENMTHKSLRGFLAEAAPVRQVSEQQAVRPGQFLYDLSAWEDYGGAEVERLFLPTSPKADVLFLYRPEGKHLFWALVRRLHLLDYEYLGPTSCGLLMMPGHYWPLAIVHDLAAAEDMYRQTYREPFKKPPRQKDEEARETFRRNLLGADWGQRTPLFTIPIAAGNSTEQ